MGFSKFPFPTNLENSIEICIMLLGEMINQPAFGRLNSQFNYSVTIMC